MIDVAAIVAKIPDPGLSSLEFFNFLAVEFEMGKEFDSKGSFLIYLKHFLHKAYSVHKKVLLIIDEAQRLNHELLEQIRLLSNIELQSRKLINIFFVGQTEFKEMLMENRNRAVRQRIAVSYQLDPLSETEASMYIRHRLKIAGATQEIFGQDAIREISSFSNGYPRLINIICDHALLTGYASNLKLIDKKVIKECEKELQIPITPKIENGNGKKPAAGSQKRTTPESLEKPSVAKRTGLIAAAVMLLIFAVYFFINQKPSDSQRWSMNEIAPQEYQGQTGEEAQTDESLTAGNVDGKDSPAVDETPAAIASPDGGASAPGDSKAATGTAADPGEADEGSTANDDRGEESGEMQSLASFPEQKVLIYFKHNSNELPDPAFETLDRIAGFLLRNPAAKISIKGFTDSTGKYSYNVSVSQFRANIIKTYLVGKGIDHTRIKAIGLGPADPIASNTTLEGRKRNRRIEIELDAGQAGG
jgi:general secretion pathway protein A